MIYRGRLIDSAVILSLLLATVLICFLLHWHIYLNGSRFHPFTWHRAPFWPVVGLIGLGAMPVFVVEFPTAKFARPAVVLPLLMIGSFALDYSSSTLQWNSLNPGPIVRHVQSPMAHSFFNDAEDMVRDGIGVREFLRTYPERLPRLHYHAQNKGPVPILYWYLVLRAFGERNLAALMGALVIGLLATGAIPATWYMVRALTDDPEAAMSGACAFTLMPAMVVLLPEFDLLYVPMTALAVGWWWQALHTGRKRYAVGAALAISVCCLFAFNVLIMGTCFLAITFLARTSLRAIVVQLAVALGTAALFYLLLYLATGYNLIATFLAAWHQHEIVRREVYRPWPATILNDPINFVIALGWLPVIVLVSYFLRADRAKLALVLVCLAQPMLVAVTGLLQTESHRLWLFMMPLLIVPVGLDLARWPREHRVALYGCQTIVLIFVTESLRFH